MIRGAAADWPAMQKWSTKGLRKRAGKQKVHSASAPYAHQLGIDDTTKPTLTKYMKKMFTAAAADVAGGKAPCGNFDIISDLLPRICVSQLRGSHPRTRCVPCSTWCPC